MQMNDNELRTRLNEFRKLYPVSLSRIGQMIGLTSEQRYVLSRFVRGKCSLYDDTRHRLDEFLTSRGY